jgi:hypothetical protein
MSARDVSPENLEAARKIFEGKDKDRFACLFCAGIHNMVAGVPRERQPCPRIKSIQYHTDGVTILSIEFWPKAGRWEEDVVFPDMLVAEEDD